MVYSKILQDSIEREKAGVDYICPPEDRPSLYKMIDNINAKCNTNIAYLAEFDTFHIRGSGEIIAKFIDQFSSESIKSYLIPQLLLDKVKDCDEMILHMYLHFRDSDEFISAPGEPAPSHISARYDTAFNKLKSKRIAPVLLKVVSSPRDAFYLPLTVKRLASWRLPKLEQILQDYLQPGAISMLDVGLCDDGKEYFPSYSFICRELKFTAINCLKFYPSTKTESTLRIYLTDTDADIRLAASKIYDQLYKSAGDGLCEP